MKRLLSLVAFFATLQASAQQVNPVPDYVFANRMSAGRNTVTDTAAYLSIGPRYGATRGMMPPMVVDTASFSGNKRNGLLIFSVQKNKFLYWDSVGVKWAEMSGTGGSAITGLGVSGYVPKFTTSTNLDSSQIFQTSGSIVIGNNTNIGSNQKFQVDGSGFFSGDLSIIDTITSGTGLNFLISNRSTSGFSFSAIALRANNSGVTTNIYADGLGNQITGGGMMIGTTSNHTLAIETNDVTRVTISGSGNITADAGTLFVDATNDRVGIGNISPSYTADISGTLRNTTSAYVATSSGNFGVGTTSPTSKADILGTLRIRAASFVSPTSGAGMEFSFRTSDSTGYLTTYSRDYSGYRNQAFYALSQKFAYGSGGAIGIFLTSSGETLFDTETDAGNYKLQVAGNIYNTGSITTGAPSGGSIKPWKIGEAATVSPTSPNRTIRVEIDGVVYYIHAKTTND
jgi:hypothetical protein